MMTRIPGRGRGLPSAGVLRRPGTTVTGLSRLTANQILPFFADTPNLMKIKNPRHEWRGIEDFS
jgi:hypothetical protein